MFWQSQLWISYRAFVLKLSVGSESSLQENKFIFNHRPLNSNSSSGDGLVATKTRKMWVCICTCVYTGRNWVCICTCVHTGRMWVCIFTCVYTGRMWVCICNVCTEGEPECVSVHVCTQVCLPFIGTSLILHAQEHTTFWFSGESNKYYLLLLSIIQIFYMIFTHIIAFR